MVSLGERRALKRQSYIGQNLREFSSPNAHPGVLLRGVMRLGHKGPKRKHNPDGRSPGSRVAANRSSLPN